MARIPQAHCTSCQKRAYRSEDSARAALGLALNGVWSGRTDYQRRKDYALTVYTCPIKRTQFHIGHNPRTIKAIETWRESRNAQPA